jgi:predicted 2-oxoglutarate/Fe(II)-dependent dioxygenase YbiX
MSTVAHELLKRLGLYVESGFLSPQICKATVQEMTEGPRAPAQITVDGATATDTGIRRALSVDVPPGTAAVVDAALTAVKPRLERHFALTLHGHEPPHYLVYERGAFFVAHRDRPRSGASELSARRVSVVLFLNDDFSGGALTFYDLIAGDEWRGVGLPCEPAAGLLVAFRSEMIHEVQAVTGGQRCTIVSWFS